MSVEVGCCPMGAHDGAVGRGKAPSRRLSVGGSRGSRLLVTRGAMLEGARHVVNGFESVTLSQ